MLSLSLSLSLPFSHIAFCSLSLFNCPPTPPPPRERERERERDHNKCKVHLVPQFPKMFHHCYCELWVYVMRKFHGTFLVWSDHGFKTCSKVLGETQGCMLDQNKCTSVEGPIERRPNSSKPNLQRLLSIIKTLLA